MTLSSPRRAPLADQVIAQLRTQITSGEWPVGSRIPTEAALVDQLGVARNTVREAVRALAHNGLLDIRQGSGTYVLATSELAGVMHRRFADAEQDQVVELRALLEASAASLASARRTERDLDLLETALARREEAWHGGDAEVFVQADAAFHQAVVAAAHNDVLAALYADLGEVLRAQLRQDIGPVLAQERYVGHQAILTAIREGDAATAAAESSGVVGACGRSDAEERERAGAGAGSPEHG
ncbi:FadR/GntR family transcriptional regulator [Kitasatospora nipponensis]|uniref:FadR/GntR family transcriptional regulator n=1 Tax=Kitasatospora nipponensis TaxID=258049 RepID=A0ABP4GVI5_9ACTN